MVAALPTGAIGQALLGHEAMQIGYGRRLVRIGADVHPLNAEALLQDRKLGGGNIHFRLFPAAFFYCPIKDGGGDKIRLPDEGCPFPILPAAGRDIGTLEPPKSLQRGHT